MTGLALLRRGVAVLLQHQDLRRAFFRYPARLKAPGSRNTIVTMSGGRFVLAIREPQAPGRTDPPAVLDVRSGATGISSDGTAYGSW